MQPVANLESVVLSLGYPRAELIHLVMMAVLFTAMGAFLFVLLTRPTHFGKEIESLFGKRVFGGSSGKVFLVVFALWFIAVSWFYNATLGSKFFELHGERRGAATEWKLVYQYPERARVLPSTEITNWTGEIVWSRRRANHALRIETRDGLKLLSVGAHPDQFKKETEKLVPFGIKVLPEQKTR